MVKISIVETFEIGLWRDEQVGGGILVSQQSSHLKEPQNYYKHNAISDRHCTETLSLEEDFSFSATPTCNIKQQTVTQKNFVP